MAIHTVKIKAENRTGLGSRAMKRLRDKGMVPGVIYGHKQATMPIELNLKELTMQIDKGAYLFELNLGSAVETVLVKEAQYDHLGIQLLHIDFSRVSLDEKVKIKVPLELRGTPKGEEDGGKLQQIVSELEIECLVLEIPEHLRHNVAEMALDSVLHIKDIKLPAGVHCLQDGELIVATVREVKEEAAAVVEGAVADPEVIGQKEREEKAPDAKAGEKKTTDKK